MLGYQILVLPVTFQRKNLMLVCEYSYLFLFTLPGMLVVDPETPKVLDFILFVCLLAYLLAFTNFHYRIVFHANSSM
jgi:hypothetical protein